MKKKFFAFTVPFLIATFLAGIYLFTGCQKNVGVINSIVKFDIAGYVYDNLGMPMAGAEVIIDGVSVATTDAAGRYTIPKLLPGNFVIEAKKTGYIKNRFTLKVSSTGGVAEVLSLKKLSTPVVVKPSLGATIVEKAATGETVASLVIPPNAVPGTADVSISVTTLTPAQAAPIPESVIPVAAGNVPGVTVSLDCSNPNITFPTGITLIFNLPFTHQPGLNMTVVTYNEGTGKWEEYTNAVVGPDGNTASLTIYHFSQWTCQVMASTAISKIAIPPAEIALPANNKFTYTAALNFTKALPVGLNKEFTVTTIENFTATSFSSYILLGGSTVSRPNATPNIVEISSAPIGNPVGRGNVAIIPWQLLKYDFSLTISVSLDIWNVSSGSKQNVIVTSTYTVPTFAWGWRELITFPWPANREGSNVFDPIPFKDEPSTLDIPEIRLFMGHNGGLAG